MLITVKLNKPKIKFLQEFSTKKIEYTKYYLPKLIGHFNMDVSFK